MLTIHGRATSVNVQLVMWTVGELGLPHRRLDVGGAHGGTDTGAFGAMNPMRLVPVLEEDGLTVFESAAILRYLAATHGDEGFWPRDPRARAALDQWAEWGKVTFAAAMMPLFLGLIRVPPSRRDQAALDRAAAEAGRLAALLDARLAAGPWIGGGTFSFADIAVGHYLYRYHELEFARADLPNLAAYYDRLCRRPAFAEHVMVSFDSLRAVD